MQDTGDVQRLKAELEALRARLEETEETLRAIRSGEVDALVVQGAQGEQIFTLKGADELYRVLVEAMTEGAVTFGHDGTILYCNARFAELMKEPQEQVIGSMLQGFVAPDEHRGVEDFLTVLGHENVVHRNILLQDAEGRRIPTLFSTNTLSLESAAVVAAVVTDLTNIVAATEAQRESEEKFRYFFEHSPLGKSITSPSGEIHVNEAFCDMLGYTEEELKSKRWQDITHPDDIVPSQQAIDALLSGERESIRFTKRYLHKNGAVVWGDVSTALRRDVAGKPLYLMTSVMDITERKQADERLQAASLYARNLIEASLDPLVTINTEGKITDVNKATEDATGLSRAELVGTDFSGYFTEPEKARAGYRHVFEQGFVRDYPLALRHRDGRAMDVLYNATVYSDMAGNIVGVFAAARDITERKRAEEELHKYHEHLEELVRERTAKLDAANQALESFAYSVSHDLRVPLRAIEGFSHQVLKRYEDKLDDEGRRYLNNVRDNTKRMSHLIDDILAFSRMGRLEISVSEIDMEKLVYAVLEELQPVLAGRNIEIKVGALPSVRGDLSMLRQVWINLLSNAIKFTRPKPLAQIVAGTGTEKDEQIYYVKDNGVGFDMQYADKLFGVFQRLHGVDEFEGTGIGLAIVKRIVTRHGGRVWAEGKVGEGATFYFALPEERPPSDAPPAVETGAP